ncbi:MAG: hypothetical protein Q9181_005690 [Wetmoreana brouardii]
MATRSELSSNWRTRMESPLEGGSKGIPEYTNTSSGGEYVQQRKTRLEKPDKDDRSHASSETAVLRGEDDPRTLQAIAEGRRLYVGNLPYIAKTRDVERLFAESNYQIEHINMSIDPYSGRNPSYCFVELVSKEQAQQATLELNGKPVLGRPVKIGPGVARSKGKRSQGGSARDTRPIFDRWTREDASDHWKGYHGRRLLLSGLPRMPDHHTVNEEIRHIFKGYEVEAVSKVVIPKAPAFGDREAWNHRYLFVDFSTAEEAERAVKEINGKMAWGVKVRAGIASLPGSRKIHERGDYEQEQQGLLGESSSLSYD